ncbi:NAD(P)/FAD-dependent oxidoreductase [Salinivibrio proteolyticus]|uniref:NAD(P)/FAD-dependent oxidoreductase n=1 Tax=Salinivibrio proteolyticus TaxID=334715 RepID=UPI000988FEF9|nr:FAD/NAD(P)-binding oxidoreductase [Salinivibrio proteolyticus]OOF30082.1 twin-arginine translocation pathway signal protein [Salinivibrio proteolyticus]
MVRSNSISERRHFLKLLAGAGALTMLPVSVPSRAQSQAKIIIVGNGAAGIALANRLAQRLPARNISLVGARKQHLYQPGQTLVASGLWKAAQLISTTEEWLSTGIRWHQQNAVSLMPHEKQIELEDGVKLSFDILVVAMGTQLNYHLIEGMEESLVGQRGIGSVYLGPAGAQATDMAFKQFMDKGEGKAIFTLADTPIKCAGAPLKMTFTSLARLEQSGHRQAFDVSFTTPFKERLFSIPVYNDFVMKRFSEQGVEIADEKKLIGIDAEHKKARFSLLGTGQTIEEEYDYIHVVPPMSAPDVVKHSDLIWDQGPHQGEWMAADQYTLQHPRFPYVFGVGDVTGIPLSKTAASVKKQVPVVEANIISYLNDKPLEAEFNGYTSCPLITGFGKAILAEFGYGGTLLPSFPFISPTEETWMAWVMKEQMLLPAYQAMLDGKI